MIERIKTIEEAMPVLEANVWEHPNHYAGFSPVGDYVIHSWASKAGTILSESNHEKACEILQAEFVSPELNDKWVYQWDRTIAYHFGAGHFAVGSIETLLVGRDSPDELLIKAANILKNLEDYPVLDEDDYSEKQYEAMAEYWDDMSLEDKIYEYENRGLELPDNPDYMDDEMLQALSDEFY